MTRRANNKPEPEPDVEWMLDYLDTQRRRRAAACARFQPRAQRRVSDKIAKYVKTEDR